MEIRVDIIVFNDEVTSTEMERVSPAHVSRTGWIRIALLLAAAICAASVCFSTIYFRQKANEKRLASKSTLQRRTETCSTSLNLEKDLCRDRFYPWAKSLSAKKSRERERKLRNISPQWTWVCRNDRCERLTATDSSKLQSLSTCNMLCGSMQLWPQPTGPTTLATTSIPIRAKGIFLKIISSPSPETAEYLKEAFDLMRYDIWSLEKGVTGKRRHEIAKPNDILVKVTVNGSADVRLRLNTDESYSLSLRSTGHNLIAEITAHSFCGARHGFETLSQLIWLDPYVNSLFILKTASVEDAPRFHYRGLLLDTARHFFPVPNLIRTIDAMAACKMNTFHWHVSDSDSFPLRLNSVPELALHGAFGPEATYSIGDINAIVRRARLRGIRVLIEVDAPAHVGRAWSWGPSAGLSDLAHCVEEETWRDFCGQPPCGQLNPLNPHVYEILERIYSEIIQLNGVDDIFHIGGDEVSRRCWYRHIKAAKPMKFWLDFTKRAMLALNAANGGKLPEMTILWSSKLTRHPYLKKLNNESIGIQIWSASSKKESRVILDAGFRVVLSHVDAWYLDCGFGSWRDNSSGHCGPYRSWQKVYNHRPWTVEGWKVVGGEICQWSEQVGPEGLDARVWPRAAAFAERLWSDGAGELTDVSRRLDMQRERLVHRGIHCSPLWSRWCSHNPLLCDPTARALGAD